MVSRNISMVDIARLADVSIATVSRVLNKTGRYSPETERKILSLVEEYGYTPNANAKSLRTNRSQSIGVVVPDITNEFFAKIVRAVEIEILPHGYSVFVCDSHEDERMENLHIANLIAKNVDGIIYISGKADAAGLEESRQIPAIYIDRCPENVPVIIQSDNERGGFLATEELIRKGCGRIVFLPDFKRLSTMRQRFAGYTSAHKQHGVPMDPALDLPDAVDYAGARAAVERLIQDGTAFDGIFATNDLLALGALHALLDREIQVPGQVRIAGFDDITLSRFCRVPLTTVTQNTYEMGRVGVELLVRLMRGERLPPQNITVPVELHVRAST